jgi:60S ribosomal subunit assembly/export protein LOC1
MLNAQKAAAYRQTKLQFRNDFSSLGGRSIAMGTTRTIKNKHAANGSGIKGSKASKNGPQNDGVIKAKKTGPKTPQPGRGIKGRPNIADILKKRKKRVYTEKELGIPELNKITPVGVTKPKGKKKGKVFVDDRVCF